MISRASKLIYVLWRFSALGTEDKLVTGYIKVSLNLDFYLLYYVIF